jgi:hypothetical protein
MKIISVLIAGATLVALAGCGSSPPASTVPTLHGSGSASGNSGGYSTTRVAALHTAAQCIRTHGVPTYQDPVLTANGQVFTDARSIQDLSQGADRGASVLAGIRSACGALMATAGFQPDDIAPAPPKLVQAGVKAAQCVRANGLPNYRDPTSATPFTPGHGFGFTANELPNRGSLGKQDPSFQRATSACRSQLDAEITASELSNLAHD